MNKIFPNKKDFLRLAKKNNLIPVAQEFPVNLETPVAAFLKMGDRPYSYLLESVEGGQKTARYSFLAGEPSLIFKSKGRTITLERPGRKKTIFQTQHDPLWELEKILKRFRQASAKDLGPFSGGAVGYLGYDTVRFIEKIPDKNKAAVELPDSLFMFTGSLFVFDHVGKKIKIIVNVDCDSFKNPDEAYDHGVRRIADEVLRLKKCSILTQSVQKKPALKLDIRSNFEKSGFARIVRAAKRYIQKGDIIQVVLSQAFRTKVTAAPFDVYRALRSINPSPYMFYLNCGDFYLAGSSPEVHVRCESRKALLRPIAGTRPRGQTPAADRGFEKELLGDPKERAEHLMLVDLGRNDLGRVCNYQSVRVPEFMTIERYSHVMHIVSRVEGQLKKNKSIFDLLRATFPAGTISGAPKVRAMEIIDELENQKRGFYSGVVGYFSYSGNLDSCIAIRTVLMKNGTAYVQAGAGVVADSDPEKEYEETCNKARAMLKSIEMAENGVLS